MYIEGRHVSTQTTEQYLGAWRSVNDLQVQLGPKLFTEFLDCVERKVREIAEVRTIYLTCAWVCDELSIYSSSVI